MASVEGRSPSAAMFRGDPAHTGVYAGEGPRSLHWVRWTFEAGGAVRSSPAVAGDRVYVGSDDGRVYGLDAHTGAVAWSFDAASPIGSSPAVADGLVFVTTRSNAILALDAGTGVLRWRRETGPDLPWAWGYEGWDYYTSSPVAIDGIVVAGSGDGSIRAMEAATGAPRWVFRTEGRVRSSPAVRDGVVYCGSADGSLYAIDLAGGALRWRFDSEGRALDSGRSGWDRRTLQSSPAVSDDTVYVGGRDGWFYAIDRARGTERWRVDAGPSWAIASAALDGGRVIEGRSDTFYVQSLDARTGAEAWRFETDGYVFSSAAIAGGLAYVGNAAGDLFALDAATGHEAWRHRVGGAIYSSPAVAGGIVYVGSDDGRVYAFEGGSGPAPRLAVFVDENVKARTLSPKVADVLGRYFGERGYERLDAAAVARFMQDRIADRARSIVVFAMDVLPTPLAEGGAPLLRRYLEAGGKVVWPGVPPLMVATDASGKSTGLDRKASSALLGVDLEGTNMDNYTIVPTEDGRAWGLRGWWMGGPGLRVTDGVTVLARDASGTASAWAKGYGGSPGTGFVRVWGSDAAPRDAALDDIRRVAEYGIIRRATRD
jgi:outer membrane protein assembly factor BamB